VRRVLDADGGVLRRNLVAADLPERGTQRRIRAVDAYLTTYLMREAVRAWYGTGHAAARLGPAIAGKTGSTNDNRDAWFIGYSPDIVTGVWVGNDDRTPMARSHTGAVAALPIWVAFMEDALRGQELAEFPIPDGVRFVGADPETGGWIQSRVHYPGWVPVAANRRARYAKFVPPPEEEEPVAPISTEAHVAERAPSGTSATSVLGAVDAGPVADAAGAEAPPNGESETAPAAVEPGAERSE
jgi:membrane carboxypeptidase/penicillin-binding protein